jgi:hypothetical protein
VRIRKRDQCSFKMDTVLNRERQCLPAPKIEHLMGPDMSADVFLMESECRRSDEIWCCIVSISRALYVKFTWIVSRTSQMKQQSSKQQEPSSSEGYNISFAP